MWLTLRIGHAPLYAIADWTVNRGDDRLVYRPSWRTVSRRLIISLICSTLLVVMIWTFGLPPRAAPRDKPSPSIAEDIATRQEMTATADKYMQDLQRTIPAEEWEELASRVQQQRAEREEQQTLQSRRYDTASFIGKVLYWTIFGLLAFAAVLAPAPWQRVVIASDPRRTLRVTKILLWPHTRVCPPDAVTTVSITAQEWWHKGRFSPAYLGWRWEVRVHGVDARTGKPFTLEFWPDLQPSLQSDPRELTPRVREFVDTLERITGVRASLPTVQLSHLRRHGGSKLPLHWGN